MSTLVGNPQHEVATRQGATGRERVVSFRQYLRRNPSLAAGLIIVGCLVLIGLIGPLFVDTKKSNPASVFPDQPPSRTYPLGSDDQGRDLLAVVVKGLPLTMEVGFIAGIVGLGVGTILGFVAGYIGKRTDTTIKTIADVLLTVPGLVVLITFASTVQGSIGIGTMALVVASLAWMWPTRTIRAQVLSMRERGYVQIAKISGMSTPEIIFYELVPNLLPYLAASFVGSVGSAILASIGLEALGLGPQNEPTMGMTIYWSIAFNALIRGLWWWWLTPIILLVLLFVGLMLISTGLDEVANPRVRRTNS